MRRVCSELAPIGRLRSIWSSKFATPRQGCLVPAAKGRLELQLGNLHARHALEGLDEFSHVWLIWLASLNPHAATRSKVRPPRLRGGKAGLFATRTPFRPNPIGLSLVRLDGVEGSTLLLSGVDLVDGTPVLDVKPYIAAYDSPSELGDPHAPLDVNVSDAAAEQLCSTDRGRAPLLASPEELRAALVQTLAADPRPVYRWRRQQQAVDGDPPWEYDVRLDGVRARCRFEADESVTVLSVVRDGTHGPFEGT